jgi:hypothetical protein
MTSALLGSWAVSGLKVPLGRKWPSGLGPVGPMDLSLPDLPGFDPEVQVVSWALVGPR